MAISSNRIELALQGYEDYQEYLREHPNGLEVHEVDQGMISRINAIPAAHDDTIEIDNTVSVSPTYRARIDHVIEVISQEEQQRDLDEWLETQEPHPRIPERIIVKDEDGVDCGSIPKSRVMTLPEEEARPVVQHSQGLPRNSTDHSEGCVIGHVVKYSDGEQEVYLVLDKKSYEHMQELLKAARSREITQAFLDGRFTYEDFLRLTTG